MSLYNNPNTNTAAANTDVVITLAAIASDDSNSSDAAKRTIKYVAWSHDEDPTNPTRLTIESPSGTVLFDVDITKGGPGELTFPNDGIPGAAGQALLARLNLNSANTVGTLNIMEGNG